MVSGSPPSRRPWLIATARRAGAGADAEDAVQDVLARLAAGVGAARATRRSAAGVRGDGRAPPRARPGGGTGHPVRTGRRSRRTPARPTTTSAGARCGRSRRRSSRCPSGRARCSCWTPPAGAAPQIARRLEVSERVVKRVLDRPPRRRRRRRPRRPSDGADCARLSATLATYAAGVGRPRARWPGRPPPRGLRRLPPGARAGPRPPRAVPAAVRVRASAPAAAARRRRWSRSSWERPIVAAVTAAGGVGLLARRPAPAHTDPAAPIVAPVARPPPPRPVTPVQRVVPRIRTVRQRRDRRRRTQPDAGRRVPRTGAAPRLRATPPRRHRRRAQPAAGCDLGTLGICGLDGVGPV